MHGLRHTKSQLLWSATNTAWPALSTGARIHPLTTNALGSKAANSDPTMWLEIDNTDNADFCLIEFSGTIAAIVTDATPPAGSSLMRAAVLGLPQVGDDIAALTDFATHPCKTETYPYAQMEACFADSVGITTQETNAFPPFFGYTPDASMQKNITDPGWPFHGAAIAAGDRFHFVFQVSKLGDGANSISGYRKLYFTLRSINPTMTGGRPTSMGISGKMYAHMYEFRGRR